MQLTPNERVLAPREYAFEMEKTSRFVHLKTSKFFIFLKVKCTVLRFGGTQSQGEPYGAVYIIRT